MCVESFVWHVYTVPHISINITRCKAEATSGHTLTRKDNFGNLLAELPYFFNLRWLVIIFVFADDALGSDEGDCSDEDGFEISSSPEISNEQLKIQDEQAKVATAQQQQLPPHMYAEANPIDKLYLMQDAYFQQI